MKYVPVAILVAALSFPALAQPGDDRLIGITRAVASAERHLSARAIEGELESRGGRLVYEIDLVRGATLHRLTVDARSGKLVSTEKPRMENMLRAWVGQDRIRAGGKAEPLAPRLAALEKSSGGEVKEVEFDMEKGRAVYEIELATNAGIGDVKIDAETGKRLELAYDD